MTILKYLIFINKQTITINDMMKFAYDILHYMDHLAQNSTKFPSLNVYFTCIKTISIHTMITYLRKPLSRIRTIATHFGAAFEAAQASQSCTKLGNNNEALVIQLGTTLD
jgi:hypothetical protein